MKTKWFYITVVFIPDFFKNIFSELKDYMANIILSSREEEKCIQNLEDHLATTQMVTPTPEPPNPQVPNFKLQTSTFRRRQPMTKTHLLKGIQTMKPNRRNVTTTWRNRGSSPLQEIATQ